MKEIIKIIHEFKKRVSENFGEVEIILFGSRAREKVEEESDVDLLVILNRDVSIDVKEKIYDIAYEIGLEYDLILDVSVYSKGEWSKYRKILPFAANVEREGIVV